MNLETELDSGVLPPDPITGEDFDSEGRFLYPGDVADAMPEGEPASRAAIYLVQTIRRRVLDPVQDSVHLNMPIYYAKGEPRRHVSPDVMVLRGVAGQDVRKSYCLWKTGIVPQVVFEVVSVGSEIKDMEWNRARYQELGIPEYFWFYPELQQLTALRLNPQTGRYQSVRALRSGRFRSQALGLDVGLHEGDLGLFEAGGAYIPPLPAQLARAERELAARDEEIARLKAELEALRRQPGD